MPDENDCEQIGYVVKRACRLEELMRRAGGQGGGLRELGESLRDDLGEENLKLLRYIGAVRNQMAHQLSPDESTPVDMDVFRGGCDRLEAALTALITPVPPPDPVAELAQRTDHYFHLCGFIPLIHPVYAMRLFYASLRPGAGLLTAAVFGLLALLPLPRAFDGGTYLFYISGGLLLCSYAYGIWHSLQNTPSTAPKALAFFPVIGEVYLVWSLIDVIKWRIFPGSLLLLLLAVAAVWCFREFGFWVGFVVSAFSYLATALTALRCSAWPEVPQEESQTPSAPPPPPEEPGGTAETTR